MKYENSMLNIYSTYHVAVTTDETGRGVSVVEGWLCNRVVSVKLF